MSNERFSNPGWLKENGFSALAEISGLLETRENDGRDALIRVLEHRQVLEPYAVILSALTQRAGLYPYLEDDAKLSTADLVDLEYHCADGLDGKNIIIYPNGTSASGGVPFDLRPLSRRQTP